jgi:serine/threonine protein kinase
VLLSLRQNPDQIEPHTVAYLYSTISENIFLKNDQWKLGDFGLVTRASSNQEVEEGDSRYMSMELLAGDRSDLTKSDVFSLGATLYEICLHRPLPMNGPEWQDIRSGRLVNPMPNTSLDLSHLISQMMNPVSSSRPSAGQLLLHPQLLSDEQKALNLEKNRVLALQQLAQSQQRFPPPTLPPRRGLMRSNTWNGSSVNSYL